MIPGLRPGSRGRGRGRRRLSLLLHFLLCDGDLLFFIRPLLVFLLLLLFVHLEERQDSNQS